MQNFRVINEFRTPLRLFSVGEVRPVGEIDGPLSPEQWRENGFIETADNDDPEPGVDE